MESYAQTPRLDELEKKYKALLDNHIEAYKVRSILSNSNSYTAVIIMEEYNDPYKTWKVKVYDIIKRVQQRLDGTDSYFFNITSWVREQKRNLASDILIHATLSLKKQIAQIEKPSLPPVIAKEVVTYLPQLYLSLYNQLEPISKIDNSVLYLDNGNAYLLDGTWTPQFYIFLQNNQLQPVLLTSNGELQFIDTIQLQTPYYNPQQASFSQNGIGLFPAQNRPLEFPQTNTNDPADLSRYTNPIYKNQM